MAWITPKTNWVSTDWLNVEDYNRIRSNILFISDLCQQLFAPTFTTDLGNEKTYADMVHADEWNAFEVRLQEINSYSIRKDYGNMKVFYDNGRGIDFSELNRIESASLDLYQSLKEISGGRKILRFRLLHNSFDNF